MTAQYIAGLDLGQAQDYTALAVLEQTTTPDPEDYHRRVRCYAVRQLKRFPLGTSYTAVCARLVEMFQNPVLKNSTLVVDQTGVGRPVVDMLKRSKIEAHIRPVTITAGQASAPADGGGWNVPKKELASTLQVLLQSRRLKVATSLPEAETLVKELQAFRVKINVANASESFESWRERDHDDLVLAVAIAAWEGEHVQEFAMEVINFEPADRDPFEAFGGWRPIGW